MVIDTTRAMQNFLLVGLRGRHPLDSPERLRRRFADQWLGAELAGRVYGNHPHDSERG